MKFFINYENYEHTYFCFAVVTAVQCPVPEAPRHGRAIYTSCAYNSIVSYECKYGYRLVGDNTRRCGADKKWSGQQPSCKGSKIHIMYVTFSIAFVYIFLLYLNRNQLWTSWSVI